MSILNVAIISRDCALVCSDSEGLDLEGNFVTSNKIVALPGTGIVVGSRGRALYLQILVMLAQGPHGGDLDSLLAAMPDFLTAVCAQGKALQLAQGIAIDDQPEQEFVIAGWSENRGRIVVRQYKLNVATGEFSDADIEGISAAPHDDAWLPDRSKPVVDGMLRLARFQVRYMRREVPHLPAGGRHVVAEVTRDRVTVTRMAELGEARESAPIVQTAPA